MKILCFIDDLGSGGAQRQLVNLGLGFKSRGHEVSFLVYHQADFFKKELIVANISVYEILEPSYIKRILKIRKFIRKGRYDTVIAFLQGPSFLATLASPPNKKWKLIVGERSADPKILRSPKSQFYRWFHIFADYVVSNSTANINMVKKINPFLSDHRCKVIYNAVTKIEKQNSKALSNPIKIIIGASHRNLKNAMGMLKAFNNLSAVEKNGFSIHWYGDRLDLPHFDSSYLEAKNYVEAKKLENYVNFHPSTTSFSNIMAESDLVGLFSFFEGSPNVICEAMALGKPVLCSKVADLPHMLQDFPEQMFDPSDVDEIVKAFRFYLNLSQDQYDQIANSNFEIAKRWFSSETSVNEYLKLMEE
ncbi:glycosyltransferase [Flavobacteriaceae bacterium KMM 6898]|nr:glycosyltransferase [Flavobacteriaceae bacterium KMM 6898]